MYKSKEEMTREWQEKGGKPDKGDCFRKSGATGVFNVHATEGSKLAAVVRTVLDKVQGRRIPRLWSSRRGRAVLCGRTW